jgi:hypothetical protein
MSGTAAPSSAVKDAIDVHSGRFEFFKQTLTLGLAGLAGIAALFTDADRIPTDVASKCIVVVAGLALGVTILFAVMGLSAYANLLNALAREAGLISATVQSPRPPSEYSAGIIFDAQIVMIALFVAWVSLMSFAGLRLFSKATTNAETALATARTIVGKETGQPPESLFSRAWNRTTRSSESPARAMSTKTIKVESGPQAIAELEAALGVKLI